MHTPGPWSCSRLETAEYYVYQIETREGHIASIVGWTTFGTVCAITDANARLIAQAPALAEALKALLAWNEATGGWEAPCWTNAQAILASLSDSLHRSGGCATNSRGGNVA